MKQTNAILRTSTTIPIILFGIIFLWNFLAFGQDWTAEQKEVWAAVQANWETFKKGDVEAALALKHDDNISWFSSNPNTFKKESLWMAYNNWIHHSKPTFVKLEPEKIQILNNVATVFYFYKWESANKEISDRGRQLEVWVKQDKKWLMTGSLGSSCDKPAPCPYGW